MTDDATDDVAAALEAAAAHQPTLPTLELPEYHGRKPVGMKTKFTGTNGRITRPHTIGDRTVLVLEVKMKADGHEETDKGLMYLETLNVLDMFELADVQGSRLLTLLRSLYRTADDAVKGRKQLPDLGDVAYVDGSGNVMTPAEVAEIRGDPVRALLADELTPVVVVYDDGSRDAWPDDFAKDEPRPKVGERFAAADGSTLVVEKLLDHRTGETLPTPGQVPDLPPTSVATTSGEVVTAPDDLGECEFDDRPAVATLNGVNVCQQCAVAASMSEADAFTGELGDDVAADWETPPRTPDAVEAALPNANDYAFIDCTLDDLSDKLDELDDEAQLERLLKAERAGRGQSLKARKGAVELIETRIAFLRDQAGDDANPHGIARPKT